jgi:Fic family protein
LEGVHTQAYDGLARAERLSALRERYRESVQATTRGGANRLVDPVFEQPIVNSRMVERRLALSRPAALTALRQLQSLGILGSAGEGPPGQLRWRAHDVLQLLYADGD